MVVVMVTKNPGDWFEAALSSVEEQDYEELEILVVDNGSLEDPTPRVADVSPGAFVKRLRADEGFSEAANEALRSVQGAPFLLFCHDDVRLAPDAVTQMVAESFRANAGIVGAKLVDWDEPGVLRSVGYGVDVYGAPSALVDPGELDQSQHDIARPVFAVSDACMLVRSDLFSTIGGFRARIPFFGEDVDLCWRTQVAGATVQFCPRAVAAHREDFDSRRPTPLRSRLALRHQSRSMMANYEWRRLLRLAPSGAMLSVAELIVSLLMGKASRAGDILAAWFWVMTHPHEIHRDRRGVRSCRRVRDVEYLNAMRKGSSRLRALLTSEEGENRIAAATRSGRERWRSATASDSRFGTAVAVAVALVVVIGARSLWFGELPSIREFVGAGDSVGDLFSEWFSGWRASGLGESAVPPAVVPGLGIAGSILIGSVGAARRLLVLLPLVLGVLGAWRLFGNTRSIRTRTAAVTAYALSPIALNALGEARLQALVAYAAAPWILSRMARHGGVEPLTSEGSARPRLAATVLLVGGVAAISPLGAGVAVAAALLVLLGPALTGQARAFSRALLSVLAVLVGAALLNAPWILAAVRHGDTGTLTGLWHGRGAVPSGTEMLTGSIGALRTGWWGWGFVVAAAVALFTGRRWRFGWALGGWWSVLGGLAAAVLLGRTDLTAGAGIELILVPVALGLAVAIAMAPAAFENDVVSSDFGFPQLASFVGLVALGVGLVPLILAATDGRWYLPAGDFDAALEVVDTGDDFRTVWIGDPDVLPMSGWPMDGVEGVNIGLSEGMTPVMSQRWRLDGGVSVEALQEYLAAAVEGRTVQLGQLLAPMAVRYVVVVDRPAPEPFASAEVAPPEGVLDALEEQLDLAPVRIGPGVELFEVSGPWPPRSDVGPLELPEDGAPSVESQLRLPATIPDGVLGSGFGTSLEGELGEGSVVAQAVTADPGWVLEVGGGDAERRDLFGWAQEFPAEQGGEASLHWSTPWSSRALQGAQLVLVLVAFVLATRRGSLPAPSRRRRVEAEGPLVVVEAEPSTLEDWSVRPPEEPAESFPDDPSSPGPSDESGGEAP